MKRLKSIDFLRGIAVILVLFRHHKFFDPLLKVGWIGVDLFFVLSGYLVSSLLFKEYQKNKTINPLRFLARRGFKIYPLFYLAIAITTLIEFNFGREYFKWQDLVSELLFVQNYFGAMWPHTWSLAIEEHFYIALAFFAFVTAKSSSLENKTLVILSLVFLMLIPLSLRFNNIQYPYTSKSHLYPTHLRFDSLLFGVLLSYLYHFNKEKFEKYIIRNQKILLLIAIALVIPVFFFKVDSYYINSIGLTQLNVGFGLILSICIVNKNSYHYIQKLIGQKLASFITIIGFYSYGIYLFHPFVIRYGLGLMHKLNISFHYRIEFLLYVIGSIFAGIFISKLIEQPLLKYRDSIVPRNTSII